MSHWTFLDYFFASIVVISTVLAITKGLAREVISIVALFGALFLAGRYNAVVGKWFVDYTKTETLANFLGFLIIFAGTLLLGAIIAFAVNRFFKAASLGWIDRLLGGVFGFMRGWAIASILFLGLTAFPIREGGVTTSCFAPYLLAGAKGALFLVPQEVKDRFNQQYQTIIQRWNRGTVTEIP